VTYCFGHREDEIEAIRSQLLEHLKESSTPNCEFSQEGKADEYGCLTINHFIRSGVGFVQRNSVGMEKFSPESLLLEIELGRPCNLMISSKIH